MPSTRQTRGRFDAINAFTDATLRDLDRGEIAVWLLLWRDTKPNGLARTSQSDLAKRAGVSERTVGRAIVSLRKAGLLNFVRRGTLRGGASIYRVFPLANCPTRPNGEGESTGLQSPRTSENSSVPIARRAGQNA